MLQRAGSPLAWHAQWKANGRLNDSDAIVMQHESICRMLETAICYDQLDIASSACFEIMCRQLQIAEDILAHKFQGTGVDSNHGYMLMSGAAGWLVKSASR